MKNSIAFRYFKTSSRCHFQFEKQSLPRNPSAADLYYGKWSEAVPPEAGRYIANIDATLMKKSINITQWKREPDIHHHCEPDDLRWRFKKAKWILVFHPEILWKCQDTVEDSFPLTGLALAIPQTRRLILSTRWARSFLRSGRYVFQLHDDEHGQKRMLD